MAFARYIQDTYSGDTEQPDDAQVYDLHDPDAELPRINELTRSIDQCLADQVRVISGGLVYEYVRGQDGAATTEHDYPLLVFEDAEHALGMRQPAIEHLRVILEALKADD